MRIKFCQNWFHAKLSCKKSFPLWTLTTHFESFWSIVKRNVLPKSPPNRTVSDWRCGEVLSANIWLTLATDIFPPRSLESNSPSHRDLHSAKDGPLGLHAVLLSKAAFLALSSGLSHFHFANPVAPDGHWTTAVSP